MKTTVNLPGLRLYDEPIQLEPLTVQEVLDLNSIVETSSSVSSDLLKIIDKKINIGTKYLYENDLTYVMWWLRFHTYADSPKRVRYVCPHCEQEITTEIDSSHIADSIEEVNKDYHKEGVSVRLSKDRVVPMKLLTLGDIQAVDSFVDQVLEDKKPATRQLCLLLKGMNPELDLYTKYRKYTTSEPLTTDELYNAMMFYQKYSYGVKKYVDITCECNKKVRLPLEVSLSDFFPTSLDYEHLQIDIRTE